MRNLGLALVLALATASLVVAAGGASASSDAVGWVYLNDNTTGVNTVAGFDRHADGTLTPLPGSPFAVGGTGTGHGTASQGSLQLSADGRYLLADVSNGDGGEHASCDGGNRHERRCSGHLAQLPALPGARRRFRTRCHRGRRHHRRHAA